VIMKVVVLNEDATATLSLIPPALEVPKDIRRKIYLSPCPNRHT
jgi:hypothetical protein